MGSQSMEAVMSDGLLVELIVEHLSSPQDRLAASLVCKLWSDSVFYSTRSMAPRCRDEAFSKMASRFSRITSLDLSPFLDTLQDSDLIRAPSIFPSLRSIRIGCQQQPQDFITAQGLKGFSSRCSKLQQIELSYLPHLHDSGIDALSKSCKVLRVLSLESCPALTDLSLEAIACCAELRQISLKGSFSFTSGGLAKIGEGCKKLSRVCLGLDFIPESALKSLVSGCPNLNEITLKYRTADLRPLASCSSLLSLSLESDRRVFMDELLIEIAAANKNLKEFVFFGPFAALSEAGVVGIVSRCPNLEKLCLEAVNLTEMGMAIIMACKKLKHLELHNFTGSGRGLAEVGLCKLELRHFALTSAKHIRDVDLQMFMDCHRQLVHLNLCHSHGPSGIGFSAIGTCTLLQYLDLSFTEVDDLSLLEIGSGARHVKHLSLTKCEGITSMGPITRFSEVESAVLDQCTFVSDEGINLLASNCPRIEFLSLAFTRVTDTGIIYLKNCKALRDLRIPFCRGVHGSGIIVVIESCVWFRHISLSHRLRNSRAVELLRQRWCIVSLEVDDMALVPFGLNLII